MASNGLDDDQGTLKLKQLLKLLAPDSTPSFTEGGVFYDTGALTFGLMTGITDVINQIGQEDHVLVYNNSGGDIDNGEAVYYNGVATPTYPDGVARPTPTIALAKADSLLTSVNTQGLATSDIPNGSLGMVTRRGIVRDFDTSGLSTTGALFLSPTTAGALTNTKPAAPNKVVVIGGCLKVDASAGQVYVTIDTTALERQVVVKSYSFTSRAVAAGTFYVGGFYDAPAADANLTQASTTQTYGSANNPYAAHPFIVAGGAGTVDTGQVGLRVTGTSIDDNGTRTPTDTDIITTDITTLSLNDYVEAKKFIGTVTFELYVVSGAPTTYSLDFNYGFAKYDDFSNKDFTVTGIEVVGLAGANDAGFDMTLFHHTDTGWTYSAAAFVPGNGSIADWSTDMSPEDNLVNGEPFAWKRSNLTQFVDGSDSEGFVVRIVTTATSAVQILNCHVEAAVDPS